MPEGENNWGGGGTGPPVPASLLTNDNLYLSQLVMCIVYLLSFTNMYQMISYLDLIFDFRKTDRSSIKLYIQLAVKQTPRSSKYRRQTTFDQGLLKIWTEH
jgi:hypothetical protein